MPGREEVPSIHGKISSLLMQNGTSARCWSHRNVRAYSLLRWTDWKSECTPRKLTLLVMDHSNRFRISVYIMKIQIAIS